MTTLLHLSDLHFGTASEPQVEGVVAAAAALAPDVVAVSGDLTQRARPPEFIAAREFLARLPGRRLVVPGNHDVPLYNVLARFLDPLARYRRLFGDDPVPVVALADAVIVGAASAHALTVAGGRLSRTSVAALRARFEEHPARYRILVVHHPVDPEGRRGRGGSMDKHIALPELGELGVDVVLTGHLHNPASSVATLARVGEGRASVAPLAGGDAGRNVIMVAAGTATSWRVRHGEANSFNVLRLAPPHLTVERHDWRPDLHAFALARTTAFTRHETGWSRS